MTVWRKALAGTFAIGLLLSQLVHAESVRADESWDVDSWIELTSTSPASGCTIDSTIEVRSDGYVVPDVDVFIGLFVDAQLVSADRVSTDENGIAYLTIDSSLADGEDAWIDVTLNDTYWWGHAAYPGAGDTCYDDSLQTEHSGAIAATPGAESAQESDAPSTASAVADSGAVIIPEVGFYVQQRNLSCEFASVQIATAAWGNTVSEYSLDNLVGWSDNPHYGYRGDITGWWGNTYDYGVYAEPLSWALFPVRVRWRGRLYRWRPELADQRDQHGQPDARMAGPVGRSERLRRWLQGSGRHACAGGLWVRRWRHLSLDPAIGSTKYYDWGTFEWMWGVMDGMSMAVYPA